MPLSIYEDKYSGLSCQQNLLRYKKLSRAIKAWHSLKSQYDRLINEQIIPLHPHSTVVIVNYQKSKHIYFILPAVYNITDKGIF